MSQTGHKDFFDSPLKFLKGVGPQRAEVLEKEMSLVTFGDLLSYYPYRYIDRTRFYKVNEITEDMPYVQLRGIIKTVKSEGKLKSTRLIASFRDDTGSIDLIWFRGITWLRDYVKAGGEFVIFGKPTLFNSTLNIVHPEIEHISTFNEGIPSTMSAMYNTTDKSKARSVDSKAIQRMMKTLVQQLPSIIDDNLPQYVRDALKIISKRDAIINIHFPGDAKLLQQAQLRLKFEELFFLSLKLLKRKVNRHNHVRGKIFEKVGEHFTDFYNHHLPFVLTGAQKRVIKEIRLDCGRGIQMNRLLQGDVGSGKTLVALMSMLLSMDNGFQACLMAPTEILAQQHYQTLASLLENTQVKVELLTGSTRSVARRKTLANLASGDLNIIVGTHALIEDDVQFRDLGLAVIDEQHRFGVAQRSRLWQKNKNEPPHILVMSATPIPRTLAMTIYGDLDVSIIDELPPGRKAIKTMHKYERDRYALVQFMQKEIALGRQIYVVYPLIEESEQFDYMNLQQGYEAIVHDFPAPTYRVSVVHGKQKPADRAYDMDLFVQGKTHIMVATTVIEVGVNVPNASVMIIESANRFGLSQLHQLRGRVGRGADQSYCILMTDFKLSVEAKERIATMVGTSDGFEIAEADLKLRGPGDIDGTQQSGVVDLKLSDLTKDGKILALAREAAQRILDNDAQLKKPEHFCIRHFLIKQKMNKGDWSDIS
jgi:ATP-dependent DNA helicase RecG